MASRKDFGPNQRKTKRPASASTRKPAAPKNTQSKAPTKPKPVAIKKSPWKLIIASIVAIAAISLLLIKLSSVDPRQIRESGINALIEEKITQHSVPEQAGAPTAKKPTIKISSEPEKAKQMSAPVVEKSVATKPASTPKTASNQNSEVKAEEEKMNYQFYDMLSKNTVETETIEAYKSTPKTAKLQKKTLLQTGSFRNKADAEKMKARLILNNLDNVKVDKSVSDNGTWYRVRSGPYLTFNDLRAALSKLNKMGILSLQIPLN
ncbi:SPOR domain-containing protein [Gammaproteobacteria bacterium AS21]